MTYHSFCPICSSDSLRYKYAISGFTLVRCLSCGLVFVKEKPSQRELDSHYDKDARNPNTNGDCVYLNQDNMENLKYYYQNLRSFILQKVSTGRVLDVGCNAGQFLDEMGGFERYGVERSFSHGRVAKEKYGENIFIGTFEDYPAPDFFFDCITLQDVLDHMVDPLEVLKKCNKLLKPQGLLVIKIHDMSSLMARIMGRKFYAFIPPTHLFYFNKNAIKTALDNSSFKILFLKHFGHVMFLSIIFYRLSRGKEKSIFFKLYKLLDGTRLGRIRVYKNLHDIVTVFAEKN